MLCLPICFPCESISVPRLALPSVSAQSATSRYPVGVSAAARAVGASALLAEIVPGPQSADVSFANLKSPLVENLQPGQMFAAPSSTAAALQTAGFTLLHLANNHIGDDGEAGLRTTLASVRAAGLAPLGAAEASGLTRQLLRTDFNGIRIGWLGCGRTLSAQNWDGPRYWEFDADELVQTP